MAELPSVQDGVRWTRDVRRGARRSYAARVARLRDKAFQIVQCAVAAAVAWWIAGDLLAHPQPFFAPIAAVLCLGTSYGQRLRRVVEVTIGVAIGVLTSDLLVSVIGSGAWQLALIVALAMSTAILLDGGVLFVAQAAVQSIVVTVLLPTSEGAFLRWTDALIGGGVALIAASLVPGAPLRRPWEQAAAVVDKEARLIAAAAQVMVDGDTHTAMALLADARATDFLVRELDDAADEGMSVVVSSPFRRQDRRDLRRLVDLVEPVDRALRSTRVLVRQTAVTAAHRLDVPASYAAFCGELGIAARRVAEELRRNRTAEAVRPDLLSLGARSGQLERTDELAAEAILTQLRSVVLDLLMVTGMDPVEAAASMPAPRPRSAVSGSPDAEASET